MSSYASFDGLTDDYLRSDSDDTYVRPIFSILPDDEYEDDNHAFCLICHSFDFGPRWVPDNGGAWVYSSSWQASGQSVKKYLGEVS